MHLIGEEDRTGSAWKLRGGGGRVGSGWRGKVAQTMYTHMNKCIDNKKRHALEMAMIRKLD
jgi:hypothetical protein